MNMQILNNDCTTMKISTVTDLELANETIRTLEHQISLRDFVLKWLEWDSYPTHGRGYCPICGYLSGILRNKIKGE